MSRRIKAVWLIIAISIWLCAPTMTANATTVFISKFLRYTVSEGSVTIVGYNGTEKEVTIPARIAGNPVNRIAEGAFEDCATVTTVHLPDTIMTIEEGAFAPGQTVVYAERITQDEDSADLDNENTDESKKDFSTENEGTIYEQNSTDVNEDTAQHGDVDEGDISIEDSVQSEEVEEDMTETNVDKSAEQNHVKWYLLGGISVIIIVVGYVIFRYRKREKVMGGMHDENSI